MAMGKRTRHEQGDFWVETASLPPAPAHPFYVQVNQILESQGFDRFVEDLCRKFYADKMGRPSLAPAIYFRLMLIGYLEGIDSERGIAWRLADSLGLRKFLGYSLTDDTPDHSTISRTRRLIDVETHQEVFTWVLKVLAQEGLLKAKTIGIDATTLEANAAMRSIVRRDSGESYHEFLTRLAKESGIETPTREELVKLDKARKNKASNDDWENPHDPDAKITKMKDGRTHLAHKAEHAVDMESGAILAVTLQPADRGDTTSIEETLTVAADAVVELAADEQSAPHISEQAMSEAVADKGYHSNDVLTGAGQMVTRTYIAEPDRGTRNWEGHEEAKGGGVRQPATHSRAARETIDEEARRIHRAQLRALLRHGRHAPHPPARPRKHFETAAHSRCRVQPVAHPAPAAGSGHCKGPAGPGRRGSGRVGATLEGNRGAYTSDLADQGTLGRLRRATRPRRLTGSISVKSRL